MVPLPETRWDWTREETVLLVSWEARLEPMDQEDSLGHWPWGRGWGLMPPPLGAEPAGREEVEAVPTASSGHFAEEAKIEGERGAE